MLLEIHVQCGRHICIGAYDNNVKCMYSNAPGHIVDCIEFTACKHKCINSSMSSHLLSYEHTWRPMHDWYRHIDKYSYLLATIHSYIQTYTYVTGAQGC